MKPYFAFQWHITDTCDQRCKHCYILPSIAKHNNVVLCRLRSSRQSHYVALAEGV